MSTIDRMLERDGIRRIIESPTENLISRLRDKAGPLDRDTARLMYEAADALEAASKRTAEVERRDVAAYLSAEEAKQDRCIGEFLKAGNDHAADRCGVRSSLVRTLRTYIERGDHEGAADR